MILSKQHRIMFILLVKRNNCNEKTQNPDYLNRMKGFETRCFVGQVGYDPTTSRLKVSLSIHLNY